MRSLLYFMLRNRIRRVVRAWDRLITAPDYTEEQWAEIKVQRLQLEEQNREAKALFDQAEQVGLEAMQEAFAAHDRKYNNPTSGIGSIHNYYAINKELKTLQAIHKGATNSEERIAGLRLYAEANPDSSTTRMSLGKLLLHENQLQAAKAEFEAVGRIADRHEDVHHKRLLWGKVRLVLARMQQAEGKYKEAEKELRRIAEEYEQFARFIAGDAYLCIGDGYKKQGQSGKARKAWKRATQIEDTPWFAEHVQKRLLETE